MDTMDLQIKVIEVHDTFEIEIVIWRFSKSWSGIVDLVLGKST